MFTLYVMHESKDFLDLTVHVLKTDMPGIVLQSFVYAAEIEGLQLEAAGNLILTWLQNSTVRKHLTNNLDRLNSGVFEHWLSSDRESELPRMFFIMHKGHRIGYIRFQPYDFVNLTQSQRQEKDDKDRLLIAIVIGNPTYWHQGYATAALKRIVTYISERQVCGGLIAAIRPANTVSLRLFAMSGFKR